MRVRLFETNWMQIEEYLRRDDRVVLPTGSTGQHGFRRPRPQRVQVLFHGWYNAPQTTAAADTFDRDQMHGGWVENFPWTRVAGAGPPAEPVPVIPRELAGQLDPAQLRTAAPDGMLDGACARPDADMRVVWGAGAAEVRALPGNGRLR